MGRSAVLVPPTGGFGRAHWKDSFQATRDPKQAKSAHKKKDFPGLRGRLRRNTHHVDSRVNRDFDGNLGFRFTLFRSHLCTSADGESNSPLPDASFRMSRHRLGYTLESGFDRGWVEIPQRDW